MYYFYLQPANMDAFDCFVKNGSNLESLPQELLDVIRTNYMEQLREDTKKKIQVRAQNKLYYYLISDCRQYGSWYSSEANSKFSGKLGFQESTNIVKRVLKIPYRTYKCSTPPEWLLQLRERLHLKYTTGFVHCLSQLKRFAGYFKQNDFSRILQFGYNLGRLQEISDNPDHTIFWQPVERLFLAQDWNGLDAYIDTLQKRFQIGYDYSILAKTS